MKRCAWAEESGNPLMISYHDREWGIPVHSDKKLFEFLILEGAQAGLTWQTVLNRREEYRKAFRNFNPNKVSMFTERDVKRLMGDAGIIRNRLKIKSAIINARQFLKVRSEYGSFNRYLWKFVEGKPIKNKFKTLKEIPASTTESQSLSTDLKKRGFTFVGPTICYAFMQAVGMVNDHTRNCFRYTSL